MTCWINRVRADSVAISDIVLHVIFNNPFMDMWIASQCRLYPPSAVSLSPHFRKQNGHEYSPPAQRKQRAKPQQQQQKMRISARFFVRLTSCRTAHDAGAKPPAIFTSKVPTVVTTTATPGPLAAKPTRKLSALCVRWKGAYTSVLTTLAIPVWLFAIPHTFLTGTLRSGIDWLISSYRLNVAARIFHHRRLIRIRLRVQAIIIIKCSFSVKNNFHFWWECGKMWWEVIYFFGITAAGGGGRSLPMPWVKCACICSVAAMNMPFIITHVFATELNAFCTVMIMPM